MNPIEMPLGKIKWRDHELALAGILALLYVLAGWWDIQGLSPQQVDAKYGGFFSSHIPFSFYGNVMFPHALRMLPCFLFLLVVNRLVIPRLLFPEKIVKGTFKAQTRIRSLSLKKVAWSMLGKVLLVALIMVFFVFFIGFVWAISFYFEEEYLFNYPGFSFFPQAGYHPLPQIALNNLVGVALRGVLAYTLYVIVREIGLYFVGRPGERRSYRVMIINQLTAIGTGIILLAAIAQTFDIVQKEQAYGWYFSTIIPTFLLIMSNLYWLFPMKRQGSWWNPGIILKLLVISFLYTGLSYAVLAPHEGGPPFIVLWILQLVVVTPVSWLLYRQRKDRILQLRGLERALGKSKADLQFLRSQINPHFLFNTLNTLYGTALQEDATRTADGVQKLGDMMRFMLHDNNRDLILMSSEIEYLNNYIYLQKLRMQPSAGILIEDNIRRDHCDHMIAPMLLIPFVENAFKHGISLKERSWVMIDLHCDEKNIRFRIRNSIHARGDQDPERNHSGIGLKNVAGRLKLLYPGKFELEIREDPGEYFVELNIQP